MKNISLLLSGTLLAAILMTSCSGGLTVQKRKYSKGFFITSTKKLNKVSSKSDNKEEVILAEDKTTVAKHNSVTTIEPAMVSTPVETTPLPVIETSTITQPITTHKVIKTVSITASEENFELKSTRKIETFKKVLTSPVESDEMMILLVLLALFLSPLAVFLKTGGAGKEFWIDLVLWLIGVGGFWYFPLAGLAMLLAIVYALLIVFDVM